MVTQVGSAAWVVMPKFVSYELYSKRVMQNPSYCQRVSRRQEL